MLKNAKGTVHYFHFFDKNMFLSLTHRTAQSDSKILIIASTVHRLAILTLFQLRRKTGRTREIFLYIVTGSHLTTYPIKAFPTT